MMMRRFIAGVLVGVVISLGVSLSAGDFGWTDTAKPARVAEAAEKILEEVRALRVELQKANTR